MVIFDAGIVLPPHKFCKRRKKKAQKTRTHASLRLDYPSWLFEQDFGHDLPLDRDSREDPPLGLIYRTYPLLVCNFGEDPLLDHDSSEDIRLDLNFDKGQWSGLVQSSI